MKFLPFKGILDFYSAWKLSRSLKKESKVVIHTHDFKEAFTAVYARKIARHKNCRIVLTRHLVRGAKNDIIHHWLYKEIDAIVFVSKFAKEVFIQSLTISLKNLYVLPNAISLDFFQSEYKSDSNLRDKFQIKNSTKILMMHGRIHSEKGFEFLFKALGRIKEEDFILFIIGENSDEIYMNLLRKLIEEEGIENKVIFLGFKNPVGAYIQQCDIGLIPSIVRESFSLSTVEYMAYSKALICTNHGAQKDYIKEGVNGMLVGCDQIEEFSEKIKLLIHDTFLREHLGRMAQLYYKQHFKYDIFYEKIKNIYFNL